MSSRVVITGIGMVTPLGRVPAEVLRRIAAGEGAAAPPSGFDATPFACQVCAEVKDFEVLPWLPEPKMLRLLNRDAQLAVAAARLALQDARLQAGVDYPAEDIGLFGATGMAGLPLREVLPLIRASTSADGRLEPGRFGQQGLRSVSPLLSFKVLANMPVCFISICEGIQGPNAIYTPWEGQGALAIEAGLRAVAEEDARCALVGGCDVRTHELAFLALEQLGLFRSWRENGTGVIPGEGAVFLVLENEAGAVARNARRYARVVGCGLGTAGKGTRLAESCGEVLRKLGAVVGPLTPALSPRERGRGAADCLSALVGAGDDGALSPAEEMAALRGLGVTWRAVIHPKRQAGNLFAAAAALQVSLGALLCEQLGGRVLANCFGYGSEQAAFVLEKP
jgi:3-oxoacyl-[acyl-carrier-protein] synthase II